jgi:signal transduction histidine kinase
VSPRILLLDDDADDRSLAKQLLTNQFGHVEIREVPDGLTFAQCCARHDFDLVIVEQQLRWADGLSLARAVKEEWPEVPVIMFVRRGDPEHGFKAARLGIDQYLVKSATNFQRLPFTVETLLERSRAQPRPAAGAPARPTGNQPPPERAVRQTGAQPPPERSVRQTGAQPLPDRAALRVTGPQPLPERSVRLTGPQALPQRAVQMAELERSNEDLSRFAALAAHELQEPLRSVEHGARVLKEDFGTALEPAAAEVVDRLFESARGLQELIADLLAHSRAGGPERRPRPVAVEDLLERVLSNLEAAVRESGAKVTHAPLPTVYADPVLLLQLLQNLIGNAIKYRSAEPPRVHLSAARSNGQWVFSVHDNGIGIEPGQVETLFTSYKRLRPEVPGSGLGLIICKQAVESMGGRIWVQSEPGQGSTFYFTVPDVGEGDGGAVAPKEER